MNENELLTKIVDNLSVSIFEAHKNNVLKKHSKLKSYKINPIVTNYLSKVLDENFTAEGIAKALFYPRVLGTSINTSFGSNIQKMFIEIGLADGSLIKGIDIEYIDQVDNRRKYCQLKSGPNTINSEDVPPILNKFKGTLNLARTNSANLSNNDMIVGILYGDRSQLSKHYQKIDKEHPVVIGEEFWKSITGHGGFYRKVCEKLNETILAFETENFFNEALTKLTDEIRNSDLFNLNEL